MMTMMAMVMMMTRRKITMTMLAMTMMSWMMTLAANTIRRDGDLGRVFNAAPATIAIPSSLLYPYTAMRRAALHPYTAKRRNVLN